MFWRERFRLLANASTIGIAFGCEAWLSDCGAIVSITVGGLCFTLSALSFWMAQGLPRLARAIAGAVPGKLQHVLSGAAVLAVAVLVTDSRWRADAPELYQLIELGGALLMVACFLGRTCIQNRRSSSPMLRHADGSGHVFLFTCMGVAGVGAQSGGLLITLIACVTATFIFSPLQQSGARAAALLGGRLKLDQTAFLFLAIPIADAIEWLQATGHLPVLLRLP